MNIILSHKESVWWDLWSQNKKMSAWPIFQGTMILPYILKTIWWMNIILWDNEINQCDPAVDLTLNVGHSDLYFMVQWFCPTPWRLFDGCTSYFWDNKLVWHKDWPKNKYRSVGSVFHGPVILLYILKNVSWINIIVWDSESCDAMTDLMINVGHSDLYFMVHCTSEVQWFCLLVFYASKHILVLLAKHNSGKICTVIPSLKMVEIADTGKVYSYANQKFNKKHLGTRLFSEYLLPCFFKCLFVFFCF